MSIFNVPVNPNVRRTLQKRQDLMGKSTRTPQELVFLNSNTSWVKLSSSVNIQGSSNLARQNVLLGGSLSYTPKEGTHRERWDLRRGVSQGFTNYNAYSNLSGNEDNLLGTRPMPGINSLSVENIGAYGSIRKAIVTFQCWDIKQLELLEQLYMRPGYTILLEFGRTVYLDDKDNLRQLTTEDDKFFDRRNEDLHNYLKFLFNKSTNSGGNYDAFFGYITNYGWSARADGGYDCKTEIISTGEILESIKVNYSAAGGISFNSLNTPSSPSIFNGHLFKTLKWTPRTPEVTTRINEEYTVNALGGLFYELYHLIDYFLYPLDGPHKSQHIKHQFNLPTGSLYEGPIDFASIPYSSPNQSNVEKNFLFGSGNNYYITLETFSNIFSKFILPNSYNESIKTGDLVGLSTKDRTYIENHPGSDLLCLFNNHMTSVNPDVCMIKNDRYLDVLNSLDITSNVAPLATNPFPNMDTAINNNVKKWVKKTIQIFKNSKSPTKELADFVINPIKADYNSRKKQNPKLTEKQYAKEIAKYYQLLRGGIIEAYVPPNEFIPTNTPFNPLAPPIPKPEPQQVNRRLWRLLTPTKDELTTLRNNFNNSDGTLGKLISTASSGALMGSSLMMELLKEENNNPEIEVYNTRVANVLNTQQSNQKAVDSAKTALTEALDGYKNMQSRLDKDFKIPSKGTTSYGNTSNIYVNLKYLYKLATDESLMSQDPSGNNILSAMAFLKPMIQGIQVSLGNVNNFEIHIDPIDGIGRIIDVNYINRDGINPNDLFSFEIGGNKSTVRDLKLESQIFSDQSSMIAISAQADAGRLGLNNSTLVAYNKGITDRMIAKKNTPLTYGVEDMSQLNNFVSALSLIANRFLKPFYTGIPSNAYLGGGDQFLKSTFNASEAGMYSNSLRDIIAFFSAILQTDNKDKSFLPTQLSLTIDGISGWVIGNLFKVNDEFIPQHYKRADNNLGYIITKINHNIVDNNWTTTIKGYPFNLDSNKPSTDSDFPYTLVINYNANLAGLGQGGAVTMDLQPSRNRKSAYEKAETAEPGFKAKVQQVAASIGASEDALVAVMFAESGINPAKVNPDGQATGLIQFYPNTGRDYKIGNTIYTQSQLLSMSRIKQMDLVKDYFISNGLNSNTKVGFPELYGYTFLPGIMRKNGGKFPGNGDLNAQFGGPSAYNQNKRIGNFRPATNSNGQRIITVGSFLAYTKTLI
jgi:hypothetical protein